MVRPMPAPSDLVHQTSTSTGTGNLTLTAVNGKRSFNTAFGTGGTNTFDYYISNRDAAEWERGTGHESGGALVRDTVLASSNGGSAVNFSAGTKDLTNDIPAAKQLVVEGLLVVDRNGSNQGSLTSSAFNKCQFTREIIDDSGWYDNATNYRYTPLVAGWYQVSIQVATNNGTGGETCQAAIYKNGTIITGGNYLSATGAAGFRTQVDYVVQMNGSTDYIEGFVYVPAAVTTLFGGTDQS